MTSTTLTLDPRKCLLSILPSSLITSAVCLLYIAMSSGVSTIETLNQISTYIPSCSNFTLAFNAKKRQTSFRPAKHVRTSKSSPSLAGNLTSCLLQVGGTEKWQFHKKGLGVRFHFRTWLYIRQNCFTRLSAADPHFKRINSLK